MKISKKINQNIVVSKQYVNLQYVVGNPFALTTAWMHFGVEAVSLWQCLGGREAQIFWMLAVGSSLFLGLAPPSFLLIILHRFSTGFRSRKLAGQSITVMAWASNQALVLLAVWAGVRSFWKMKCPSPYRSPPEGIMKSSETFC